MSETKPYENLKVKSKDSEADIQGEVAWDMVDRHRRQILEELRADFEAPGFRKGKVPMEVFLQHVREDHVVEDAAERTLQEAYPAILEQEGLRTLGRPEVTITKLAPGNPLEFRIRVGLVPEVKLPDYKKIAKEVAKGEKAVDVSPEEVEKVIDELRALRHGKSVDAAAETGAEKEPLPELTDEFVKTLGNFSGVDDFRAKLKENMKLEKEVGARRELREKLAATLGEKAKMTLPASLLDAEADAMQERFKKDLEEHRTSFDDYLKKSGKTAEALRQEHRDYIERQLRTRFLLEAIADAEGIAVSEEEIDAEAVHLEAQHPEMDPESIRRYTENVLRNEKVLAFLESGGAPAASEPPAAE